jgi:hypothetical protein
MSQIVNVRDYSPSTDMSYAKAKINAAGGKNVSIMNSKVRKATYLSTPLMLTWGMGEFRDEKSGKVSYDLSLQFPNADYPDEDGEMFLEKLKQFEEKVKADAINNSKEWFNKPKMSADVIDALWTPMLKYPKNKETQEPDYTKAPSLKVKIPYWDGDWKIELYDMEQRQIWPSESGAAASPVELIPKLTRIACVLQCGGIWFANGKFGVTWKLFQAVVKPPQSLRGTCHIKLSSTDRERMTQSVSRSAEDDEAEVDDLGTNTTVGVHVQDSDDEGSQPNASVAAATATAEPEASAEEVSSARKKVVRRKKTSGDE